MRALECLCASLQFSASLGSRMQCQDDNYRAKYFYYPGRQGVSGDVPRAT